MWGRDPPASLGKVFSLMDLQIAEILAKQLIFKYGLLGWTFRFDRAKRRFGLCVYHTHTISLSRKLVELNNREAVEDTIRHEIAHALTNGLHDKAWKEKAKELGCSTSATADRSVREPEAKFRGFCKSCGIWLKAHRRTRKHCLRCWSKHRGLVLIEWLEWK